MNKCLKIMIPAIGLPKDFLADFIQKYARKFNLEGIAQMMHAEHKIKIIACGLKEDVDAFLDMLHKGSSKVQLGAIEVEPFVRDKDYRGVFRVIE